ncbi:50S ribosomal protein L24 [Candidatus Woesearchaeota archaeon]|nr:50S ribosomal protein L24 [Candidatus Woesearchaeota archaeon]
MRASFSSSWTGSRKPSKQRKFRFNAPLHVQRRFVSAHLSDQLRERHKRRSVPVRKGDAVKVMRGQFRGRAGKVEKVITGISSVYIAGVERKKHDGSKSFYPVDASKIMITELDVSDKRRMK